MSRLGQLLKRLGIRAPWHITGPASSPEYLSHLPRATEYRAVSPGSFPTKASVPYAEPDRVYDIKYFTRDSRRSDLNTKVERRTWTLSSISDDTGSSAECEEDAKPKTQKVPNENVYRWSDPKSILDTENNGYTL